MIQRPRGEAAGAARWGRPRRAFTLIELLVVIVVIGLLILAIYSIGSKVLRQQKVRGTQQIMRTIDMAIDQFKELDPLHRYYGVELRDTTVTPPRLFGPTFGPYPPYQLDSPATGVAGVLEPAHALLMPKGRPGSLAQRLAIDWSGASSPVVLNWVCGTKGAPAPNDPRNDDNRALYTYLKLKCGAAVNQVPPEAVRSLADAYSDVDDCEKTYRYYVNPTGQGSPVGQANSTWVDGLYFVDAWGVPLDYFLYVKLEWSVNATGVAAWRVTDRVPVLRSRGIVLDAYKTWLRELATNPAAPPPDTKDDWIFSAQFPSPEADGGSDNFRRNGTLPVAGNSRVAGWARAVGAGDEAIGYLP